MKKRYIKSFFNNNLYNKIINKVSENRLTVNEYKQITDLYSYTIRLEKVSKKIVLNKIYKENCLLISLSAIVWNINYPDKYEKIISDIKIPKKDIDTINIIDIQHQLILKIYRQVIKNKIMMI